MLSQLDRIEPLLVSCGQRLDRIEKASEFCESMLRAYEERFERVEHTLERLAAVQPTEARGEAERVASPIGQAASAARSTVTFEVDGQSYSVMTFMDQFARESVDNPNGLRAWSNNRTHPRFYASFVARLEAGEPRVVVDPGTHPAASHPREYETHLDYRRRRHRGLPQASKYSYDGQVSA